MLMRWKDKKVIFKQLCDPDMKASFVMIKIDMIDKICNW
jgi:hypothetical protein